MNKLHLLLHRLHALPLILLAGCASAPASESVRFGSIAQPAPEWNALLARETGWLSADGIFAVALDGRDGLSSAGNDTHTLLWFSDTMIGRVDRDGSYAPGSHMINNTIAVLHGEAPEADRIRFHWLTDEEQVKPRSVFTPKTPESRDDEWYWLGDGFVHDGTVTIFGMRMTRKGTGDVFDFVQRGHTLIRIRIDADDTPVEAEQIDLPLWSPAHDGRTALSLASGLLLHDADSGARNPDGFLYVYGTWNRGFDKELVVTRVRPEDVADPTAWRFWDGAAWSENVDDLAPICGGVSSELSVTPLPDGRYLLVFQEGGIGEWVAVRLGVSPIGPFGPVHRIWRCPEVDEYERVFVYNAKAHPHLSPPGEVLITYNVNSFDFWGEFLKDASIYRPRFVRLPLDRLAEWE